MSTDLDERQDAAYRAYLTAKSRFDETLSPADALSAGHAWAAFLELFVENTNRPSAKILPLTR